MSPLKSKAAKEFGTPRPSLPPPERKGHPGEIYSSILKTFSSPFLTSSYSYSNIAGKSSPMMEVFSSFSMVGVYETRKGLKFVHVTSEVKCLPVFDHHSSSLFLSQKFVGKFTILIFMDNR